MEGNVAEMTELDKNGLDKNETEERANGQEREENLPESTENVNIEELIDNKLNEIRDGIGSRINPIFVAANKLSSNVRQALDLETDPGLLEEPEFGDIICVHRIGYEHYGVYAGDNKVIHYDIDPSDHYKICVHQAPMEEFLNGSLVYSICEFPKVYGRPTEEIPFAEFRKKFAHPEKAQTLWDVLKISNYHLYTPEETVIRARERIGESSYNLWTNNCEHFAIWCKTGISESHQIEDLMSAMAETGRQIRRGLQAGLEIAADFAEEVGKRIEQREKDQTKQGTNSV
ncbi:MAG: lecithin retinol acyltransferase family protein [Acidaminococcaceae bacterium]|nr:lecithin retinol acyltransferase family protein [Acidaminococcaceae bacterium]